MYLFENGDLIDNRFNVLDSSKGGGGMGRIMLVKDKEHEEIPPLILKYCNTNDPEILSRFRREVRLLGKFKENPKVVQAYCSNVDHNPPYFVMPFYTEGSLDSLKSMTREEEELIVIQMIDCIMELHLHGIFHRDIKPENFLINEGVVVVADFGLGLDPDSDSRFTNSLSYAGTEGYLPPELRTRGRFKDFDARSDIYMLGKSIYALITNNKAHYIDESELPAPLRYVISKACNNDINSRYNSVAEFKQSIVTAYNAILKRVGPVGMTESLVAEIEDRLKATGHYSKENMYVFISSLQLLETEDLIPIVENLSLGFIKVLASLDDEEKINEFLDAYEKMISGGDYRDFSFAEIVTDEMYYFFKSPSLSPKIKARALSIAISISHSANRFKAMGECKSMIIGIDDPSLADEVIAILPQFHKTFIKDIAPSSCKSAELVSYLRALQQK